MEEKKQKKFNPLMLIIAGLLALILLGGAGTVMIVRGITVSDIMERFEKEEDHILRLEGFVVNLEEEGRSHRYLRTQISLLYRNGKSTEMLVEKNSQIRDAIILTLMGYTSKELLDSMQVLEIKEHLRIEVNRAVGMDVIEEVYFTEFLIQ